MSLGFVDVISFTILQWVLHFSCVRGSNDFSLVCSHRPFEIHLYRLTVPNDSISKLITYSKDNFPLFPISVWETYNPLSGRFIVAIAYRSFPIPALK